MILLKRYLVKEFITSTLLIMAALLAMFAFFDLIQELDSLGKGSYGLSKVLFFVALSAPGNIYDVAPVAVLVGSMIALGQLSRHSELTILRVSGISLMGIAWVLLRVGIVFTILTFIIGELITPISEKSAQRLKIKARDAVVAQDFQSGLWVKDGNSFVNVKEVSADVGLLNINIYEFDDTFHLKTISAAKSAIYDDKDSWRLSEVTQTFFSEQSLKTQFSASANWKSLIRPELLNILLVSPEKMSAWNLYAYIKHLSINKQKTSRHEMALWAKMIYPLACLVMVILALPFGFLQPRSATASTKILAGIMIGVTYQIMNRVFMHLGFLNDWPPFFSAVTPTLIFLFIAVMLIYQVERR